MKIGAQSIMFVSAKVPKPPTHFLQRLESLRGLAAFSVAVHHSFSFIQARNLDEKINRGVIQAVFYGHGAVLCFFLLSGLVLGQSLRRLNPSNTRDFLIFYIRRILRIVPAFILSIVFCFLLLALFSFWRSSNPAATAYYFSFYNFKASTKELVSNLLLLKYTLNNVTWSLYPELVGSLMLPWFHVASKSLVSRAGILLSLLVLSMLPVSTSIQDNASLLYLWMFYVGYLIADLPPSFWIYFRNHSLATIVLLLVAGLVCLATPHFGHHPIPYVLAFAFIIAIIFGLPQERVFSFLDYRAMAFLGRISYSFYLFHFPIAYSIASAMLNIFNQKILIAHCLFMSSILTIVSVGITAPVSWCSFKYVEKPFVLIGKRLFKKQD